MAVPKRRMSRANTRSRRANWISKIKPVNYSACPQCGAPKLSHVMCETCGMYKGRQILEVA
ncbi:MAG: 50S ribosomal protein L32 [Acidimicrobiales bacterium]|nr:MAG: 50S ribosomal protein L32 [Acidimicrobiales bacterium]